MASVLETGALPPVAEFMELGIPGGVRREGGSIVRIERRRTGLAEDVCEAAQEMARTASATANSSLLGSKMIFWPTAMTRRVTGGFSMWVLEGLLGSERGKREMEAAQSSSKRGSSSCSDLRAGRRAERSAKCMVKERSGSG